MEQKTTLQSSSPSKRHVKAKVKEEKRSSMMKSLFDYLNIQELKKEKMQNLLGRWSKGGKDGLIKLTLLFLRQQTSWWVLGSRSI